MRSALLLPLISLAITIPVWATDYPAPAEGDWVVNDFRFHTGEVLPELRLHYRTIGNPGNEPVLILHGTGQSGAAFLTAQFGGELFGAGQPLDASKHYIILPDALGAGKSTKPSDGMRAKFPRYSYDDIVRAQYRLVSEHLGVKHVRRIIGFSAGGMQTWMWGEMFPDFMDALVPMAAEPAAMAGRNWMMRRMVIDSIRNDPEWKGGDYSEEPHAFRLAQVYFGVATSGGALAMYNASGSREKTDQDLERRLSQAAAASPADANNVMYDMDASRDYDPSRDLEKIRARVLAINSADDERNPPELGVMEAAMKRIKNGRYVLIPISPETRGHGTTGNAKLWKKYLEESHGE
jgi:homoserine O-acetyltransferase/O-succinyltransferase